MAKDDVIVDETTKQKVPDAKAAQQRQMRFSDEGIKT